MNVVSSNRSCRVHAVWSGWLRGAALAVACVPAAVAPYAHGLASFGVAGHFAYQIPYGRDNKPFGPWPINTSVQLEMVAGACGAFVFILYHVHVHQADLVCVHPCLVVLHT